MNRTRLAPLLAVGIGGCSYYTRQSVLHPAGPQAERAADLWWFLLWTATAVCVAVTVALLHASFHRERPAADERGEPVAAARRGMRRAVVAAVGATTLVLFAFLFASFRTGRALTLPPRDAPLTVAIDGRQWWWEVRYADPAPQRRLTTANELYIPVGRPVVLELTSSDVIHSFWVPNLAGKRDLIPGHTTTMWLRADRPGVYRAQCAEFCGHQHANMALFVVAVPADSFATWYEAQLRPAAPPSDSLRARGREVFLTNGCVMCHAIFGTPAGSGVGPELTHVASRLTIAAGTLPNTRGHLAGWILDPQESKPGAKMPPNPLAPSDLQALLAYLEGLR